MELTRESVRWLAAEYAEQEPLYGVEAEQIQTFPRTFEAGTYGWRDAEWVVRWYFRRHLGEYPADDRRRTEMEYATNNFEAVRRTIKEAIGLDEPGSKVAVDDRM